MNDETNAVAKPEISSAMLSQIDIFLEDFYKRGKEAGKMLADADLDSTQVRGLQNIIVSATRFSQILNFIKNQVGKETGDKKEWRKCGKQLLQQLETLEKQAGEMASQDPALRLEVKLRLARGWGKQVVANYLFLKRDS